MVWQPYLSARKSYKKCNFYIQNLQKLIWFAGNIMQVFNQHEEMFLINLLACSKYIKAELINGSSVVFLQAHSQILSVQYSFVCLCWAMCSTLLRLNKNISLALKENFRVTWDSSCYVYLIKQDILQLLDTGGRAVGSVCSTFTKIAQCVQWYHISHHILTR